MFQNEEKDVDNVFKYFAYNLNDYYNSKEEETIGNDNNERSHIQREAEKENDEIERAMISADELSSPFKLIIDENDFALKDNLENKIEDMLIAEKEKIALLFRNFPGIARHNMPELSLKEENFRKAKKCTSSTSIIF